MQGSLNFNSPNPHIQNIRVPSLVHRSLAAEATDLGVSINRLASAKLALS